ncbi:MAG: hypothetical protein ACT4OX_14015 [Actinomycetota bacterium]
MLLAECVVRHTRRHMPTRRVALEHAYLPTTGPAHGVALLGAVIATQLPALDEEERALLGRLVAQAAGGLTIPRIGLRHRLQHDLHGLDRSRHAVFGEAGRLVVELDVHGARVPQLLGAVMAAAVLPPAGRRIALGAIREVVDGRWSGLAPGVELRLHLDRRPVAPPPLAGTSARRRGGPPAEEAWLGVPADQRWAMEVLGLRGRMEVQRDDVNRRFRRLLRDAHPDHGGAIAHAATRIEELTQAREILLEVAADGLVAEG